MVNADTIETQSTCYTAAATYIQSLDWDQPDDVIDGYLKTYESMLDVCDTVGIN